MIQEGSRRDDLGSPMPRLVGDLVERELQRRTADRRVCFLTHAWRSCVHPDPDGATLAALLRFLRHPLGAHIVGVRRPRIERGTFTLPAPAA